MARPVDLSSFDCSVARTLDVVGDKWSLLVLRDAFYGVRRFGDFVRDLGIARNVLTDRLDRLVAQGVLRREQYLEHPPRDEYRLTAKGRDLLPVILAMMHWGDTWADGSGEGHPRDLVHRDCGAVTHAVTSCAACGETLTPFNIEVLPLPPVIADVVAARAATQDG